MALVQTANLPNTDHPHHQPDSTGEFRGLVLSCFTLSRLTIFPDVSLIKPEVSLTGCSIFVKKNSSASSSSSFFFLFFLLFFSFFLFFFFHFFFQSDGSGNL